MDYESSEEQFFKFVCKLIVYAALVFGLHAFYYGTADVTQWTMTARGSAITWYVILLIFF